MKGWAVHSLALYRDVHLRRARILGPRSACADACQGIFKRISAAIERWQQGHTEQEAGRFIAEHGGRITDDVERQLAEHFSGRGFPPFKPPRSFGPFPSL